MTPTPLGELPTNAPVPMGLMQRKWGNVDGNITWNNTVAAQPLQDNTGGQMRIDITPSRPGWWLVHASTMWHQADAIWVPWEWWVTLSPADADGRANHRTQINRHSACGWTWSQIDCAYRLNAATAYTAYMWWAYSGGYNQHYNTRWDRHYIEGEFIAEGAL
jgi:hypothetical protein